MLALRTEIALRRSHLDSVAYRILVELLSLDLDGGENPKSEDQNSEFAKKSNSEDAINKEKFGLDDCSNNIEATNLENVIDLEKFESVRAQNGSYESREEAGRRSEMEPVFESGKLCNDGVGEREQQETPTFSDPFAECSGVKKLKAAKIVENFEEGKVSGEQLKDSRTVQAQIGNSESVEVLDIEKEPKLGITIGQLKHDNEPSENIGELEDKMQHDSYVYSDPLLKYLEMKSLIDNKGGEDFEEGEISGEDAELTDEYVEIVHENSKFEDEIKPYLFGKNRSTSPPKSTFSDVSVVDMRSCRVENRKTVHVKTAGVAYDSNLSSKENEEVKLSADKKANGQVKNKRSPLTDGLKAKRKMVRKRKRAMKEREQGVKRLKLQPVVKPKVVKYCNFYLAGRCQQGDACKFSHDTTPLTKSQPCKFFACGTCMKSDDCPFDHQLSKYPCHKHMSKGMCPRGDSCMFSHKLSIIEDTSPASVKSNKDPLSSSGKPNLMKHLSMNINQSQSNAVCSPQSIAHYKHMMISVPKIPTQIPNGVQFLSIGEKCNQQKQGKPVILSQSEKISMLQRMLVRGTANNSEASKKSNGEKSFDKAAPIAPKVIGNKTIPAEVTEASKILEEFLFCGTEMIVRQIEDMKMC